MKKTGTKTTTGKAAAKKPAAKKSAVTKTPAVKKTASVKKPAAAKEAATKIILQFGEISLDSETLMQNVENFLKYDREIPVADQKNVGIYVKPEEGRAYVVVDGTEEGSILL